MDSFMTYTMEVGTEKSFVSFYVMVIFSLYPKILSWNLH